MLDTIISATRLILLINNAAISLDHQQKKTKEEFMALETNVVGTFLMTKYASNMLVK